MIAAWERRPDNAPFVIPWDEGLHRVAMRDPDIRYFILDEHGEAVGFVLLAGLLGDNDAIEFRRIVVVDKGRGHGRAAVDAVKAYAFNELKAHRLWLDALEHNDRARRLYESAGFRVEGVLRDVYKGKDGYESLVLMSMLAPEYFDAG